MRRRTPIGALLEGAIAGASGPGCRASSSARPSASRRSRPRARSRHPSRSRRASCRRRRWRGAWSRGWRSTRPLDKQAKRRAGELVHFGFGAAWGGLYGLLRASLPRLWSPAGLGAFALGVWAVGDNLIVPAFALGAWPQRNPLRIHGYYATAHLGLWRRCRRYAGRHRQPRRRGGPRRLSPDSRPGVRPAGEGARRGAGAARSGRAVAPLRRGAGAARARPLAR